MLRPRLLLKILLASLVLAAVVGVVVVLTAAHSDIADNTIHTLLATAAVSLGLLAVAATGIGARSRPAAIMTTALMLIEYLIILCGIWQIPALQGRDQDKIWAIGVSLVGAGIPAIACVRFLRDRRYRSACQLGLVVSAAVLILWLIASTVRWNVDSDNLYGYGWLLLGLGAPAAIALIGYGRDRWHWRWIGVACAGAAYAMGLYNINKNTWPVEPFAALTAAAIVVAHANLALRTPLKHGQRWLALATIAATAIAAVLVNLSTIDGDAGIARWNWHDRLAAASSIVAGCGSLALCVLATLAHRSMRQALEPNGPPEVTLFCPICTRRQTISQGGETCPGCGARIIITVQAQPA